MPGKSRAWLRTTLARRRCSFALHLVYYTQTDPIGLGGGINVYGYGAGDPINNSDPSGLTSCVSVGGSCGGPDLCDWFGWDCEIQGHDIDEVLPGSSGCCTTGGSSGPLIPELPPCQTPPVGSKSAADAV